MGTAYYYVDSATCLANASSLTMLCQILNGKGIISDQELELIRHEQLQKIDDILVTLDLPPVVAELLEYRRDTIEGYWFSGGDEHSRRSPPS